LLPTFLPLSNAWSKDVGRACNSGVKSVSKDIREGTSWWTAGWNHDESNQDANIPCVKRTFSASHKKRKGVRTYTNKGKELSDKRPMQRDCRWRICLRLHVTSYGFSSENPHS